MTLLICLKQCLEVVHFHSKHSYYSLRRKLTTFYDSISTYEVQKLTYQHQDEMHLGVECAQTKFMLFFPLTYILF